MANFTQANRSLALGTPLGDDVLLLTQVTGHEELGRLFEFQLSMQSTNLDLKFEDIIGKNVTIRLEGGKGSATRYFNGFIKSFQMLDVDNDMASYQATMVPWLWFLTQTSDCRIFQKQKVPEIIKKVFQDAGFNDFEDQSSGSFREREFCVQYRETDFNFVSRLMEEEGIYYYFQHEDGKHTLIMTDSISGHESYPSYEKIEYREYSSGESGSEFIRSWQCSNHFLTTAYAHRDFDFKKPRTDLLSSAEIPREHEAAGLEIYDYPGEYVKGADGDNLAKVRISEIQAGHDLYHGSSDAQGIQSGSLFDLEKHLRSDQNASYLITAVQHTMQGDSYGNESSGEGELYQCTFSAVKKETQYRAARITAKPLIQGPQTAVVVGPAGEEIHVDEFGRVKVQFHWDRYGAFDDKSSCWVRVSHAWAGKKWGAFYTPRIGQEVIVEFLEGDPDHPIITGRVYNAECMPPYDLPADKTKSTLKSCSSKGGTANANFNEIRFEDKKGSEEVYIHAEKDQNNIVENNETTEVGNDRTENVGNNEKITIGKNRTESVGSNETISISKNRTENVGNDETITISKNRTESVGSNETISISKNRTENVGNDEKITIGKNRTESVGKDDALTVGKNLTINAGDQIFIRTGESSILMKKDGTIQIKGKDITIKGSGAINVKASKNVVIKGKKILEN